MSVSWQVPGRLEVFGKHTDYAGGRSLLAAVDRGITLRITESSGDGIVASTAAAPGSAKLAANVENPQPPGHWSHYVQTAIDRLHRNFGELAPCEISIESDLPLASGMSSSSALVVACAMGLADFNNFPETDAWKENISNRIDMAGYCACIENGMTFGTLEGHRGVGTFGGSEDHTGMLCCNADELSCFSFCPIELEETVPFSHDYAFVVMVSGVLAEKTGAALHDYNRASLATRELVDVWNEATGRSDAVLNDALSSSPEAYSRMRALVANNPELTRRLKTFWAESEGFIPAAIQALREDEMLKFAELAFASHFNADEGLKNQLPETNGLVNIACDLGAFGSCGFGAGFGGSVWALTRTESAGDFADEWLARYRAQFPDAGSRASTLVTRPGPAARRL